MLPKSERLTKSDFIGLRPKMVFRGTYIEVATAPHKESKFACIISKKRIKRAVDRNRARRRVYNILNEVKPKSPALVIIYPKQNIITADRNNVKAEIKSLFDTL